MQVTDALNSGALSPPAIPYDLMRTLLHSPAVMGELRSFVASGSGARASRSAHAPSPCAAWVLRQLMPSKGCVVGRCMYRTLGSGVLCHDFN